MKFKQNTRHTDPRYFINEKMEPMTPEYVRDSLTGRTSALTGEPFMVKAMQGLENGDYRMAANAVMDALQIDDRPAGAEEKLEAELTYAQTEEDLAAIGAEWGTVHFRGGEEVVPLRLSTPKEDPWKFKKRLGIGGSVHDRLGGPRHKEKK